MIHPPRGHIQFGKGIEYKLMGQMLLEGLSCYVPLADDHGVDCVIRKPDGSFIEVQIKASSRGVHEGDAALFAAIRHEARPNYYFVFYSERMDRMWILSSEEFLRECHTNQRGQDAGLHSISFNGCKRNPATGKKEEYCRDALKKYLCTDFSRFR